MNTPVADPPQRRADWVRAGSGIQLAGFAVFLLMNTTGTLPWSFWADALVLWPVLIIAAGIRIAFEKSSVPWLVLAGPALVLGSLAWVASDAHLDLVETGPWREQTLSRSARVSSLELRADLVSARLQVAAEALPPDTLATARSLLADEVGRMEARDDAAAQIRIVGGDARRRLFLPARKRRWSLRVPADLPLRFEMRGVALRGELDLSRGHLARGRIDGVFHALDLKLPAPERPVDIEVRGVFALLALDVPEGTPVEVRGAGFPFNISKRSLAGIPGRAGYRVDLQSIFTIVSVETHLPAEAAPGVGPHAPPREPRGRPEQPTPPL